MKATQHHTDYQVVPYPKIRRFLEAAFRSTRHKPMIHSLLEMDVTRPHTILREHKAKTGESLSFTAFLIACLAKTVDEHKAVQAFRKGGWHLVLFEDVDVFTYIERDVTGQKQLMTCIIRAANRKSFLDIHREIRAAQVQDVTSALAGLTALPSFLPAVLFRPFFWAVCRIERRRPQLLKEIVGTVGLTSVGMFGTGAGWGILPAPPTTLAVTAGGIGQKQVMVDGHAAVREYLSLTLSFDHDIVDGAPAARFTRRLKELIESGYGLDEAAVAPKPAGVESASRQKVGAMRP